MACLMEVLNESSEWPNAARVDRSASVRTHEYEGAQMHTLERLLFHQAADYCFQLQALRTHLSCFEFNYPLQRLHLPLSVALLHLLLCFSEGFFFFFFLTAVSPLSGPILPLRWHLSLFSPCTTSHILNSVWPLLAQGLTVAWLISENAVQTCP